MTIINDTNIHEYVKSYCSNERTELPEILQNIPIGEWDVSNVTDMSNLFADQIQFNEPLKWDTSKVTNMENMFYECINFNQSLHSNLNIWNTNNVTNMIGAFDSCKKFNNLNEPLNWDTSNVTNMRLMFSDCRRFNVPLIEWNTSKVTDTSFMFYGCEDFDQLLESNVNIWNTSIVTNMDSMFTGCKEFNNLTKPLNWNTSQVTNMQAMFFECVRFNVPLNWNTSKVTNMARMFSHCKQFNQPLKPLDTNLNSNVWNTSEVNDMQYMFYGCEDFDQSLQSNSNIWNTGKVTDMQYMFASCLKFNNLGEPLNWNTNQVTDMQAMFNECLLFNTPLINWDTINVTNAYEMFHDCWIFNQPLLWNVDNMENMSAMFQNCRVFDQDLSNWNINPECLIDFMFDGCPITLLHKPLLARIVPEQVQNTGIAFHVHNAFKNIDILKLINFFNSKDDLADTFLKMNNSIFKEFIKNTMYEFIELLPELPQLPESSESIVKQTKEEIDKDTRQYTREEFDKLFKTRIEPVEFEGEQEVVNLKIIIGQSLSYVKQQPNIFKKLYVTKFVDSCITAYNPRPSVPILIVPNIDNSLVERTREGINETNTDENTQTNTDENTRTNTEENIDVIQVTQDLTSCVKGVLERFVLIFSEIYVNLDSQLNKPTDPELTNIISKMPEYKELTELIIPTNVNMEILRYYNLWIDKNKDKNEIADGKKTLEEKMQELKKYLINELGGEQDIETNYKLFTPGNKEQSIKSQIDTYVESTADRTDLMLGGKHRKKTRKNKKKKIKTVKLKQKKNKTRTKQKQKSKTTTKINKNRKTSKSRYNNLIRKPKTTM
jgi:surface protein